MNDTKYLIITYHKDAYFFPYLKTENIVVCEPVRNKSSFMRALFRIPFFSIFSYAFRKELRYADKVIVFDSAYNKWLGLYLKKKKKDNVYLYFWNPIEKMYPRNGSNMIAEAKEIFPVYSFDHNDCKKYGLQYRPMVYSSDVISGIDSYDDCEYDVFFLGWKKDRYRQIESLYRDIFKDRLKCLLILVGDEDRSTDNSIIYTTKRVPYSEYLSYVRNSRAILDIPQDGQEGLTIRNVECMFLRKKMITTNIDVRNYDFYDENNVFVISEDDVDRLKEFITSKYVDISDDVKLKYDFASWIETFE